jgi:hypothetical protein
MRLAFSHNPETFGESPSRWFVANQPTSGARGSLDARAARTVSRYAVADASR